MLLIFIALLAMAVADITDACSTVAESRGSARLAGVLTATDNTLTLFVAAVGADTLITKGLGQALVMGALVWVTTYNATSRATRWATKHVGSSA